MTIEEAKAEIVRLNLIAEGISPEYLRLQAALNFMTTKIKYCQAIIDGNPIKSSEEITNDIEQELADQKTEEAKDEPAPIEPKT